MSAIFDLLLNFPTVLFTVPLAALLLYWGTVLLGIMDLEIFDGLGEWLGIGGEVAGGASATGGSVLEAGEGVEVGSGDAASTGSELGEEAGSGGGQGDGILSRLLGIGQIPLVIPASLVVGFGWLFSLGGSLLAVLVWPVAGAGLLVAVTVLLVALTLALACSALTVRPLLTLMGPGHATRRHELVGRTCRVSTGSVDENFGQAEVDIGGAPLLVQVRSRAASQLSRGEQALIFDYDPEREVFYITEL